MTSKADIEGRGWRRYLATGNIETHRAMFQKWAWRWDEQRKCWIEENRVGPNNISVRMIRNLPGVVVTEEFVPAERQPFADAGTDDNSWCID